MTSEKPAKPKISVPEEAESIIHPDAAPRADESEEVQVTVPEIAAVIILRTAVVFPGMVAPLPVGREKSRRLLADVLPDQRAIVLLAQRDVEVEEPSVADLYEVGTAARVLKLLRNEDGSQTIIVHGVVRVHIDEFVQTEPYFKARVSPLTDEVPSTTEMQARLLDVRNQALRIVQLSPNVPEEATVVINRLEQPGPLSDFLGANLPLELSLKQQLLTEDNVLRRLEMLQRHLIRQVELLELSGQIQEQVRANIDKDQREYFLREQLKAIQKELGQIDEQTVEMDELRKRIDAGGMNEQVKAECLRQLRRLERIPPVSPEYTVTRTYLDVMVELPWNQATQDNLDIRRARRILEEDHYGLDVVKKRILEYLAVRKLAPGSRGPVLCFVGPPGTGKTSIGQSIARALGRKFIRMSLGGMRDEAELRGHRRTYIGAMPGRIIQEIRKVGSNNPVFMLDELDKVGMDFRGDPSSALLEVLDPAQNFSFQDHYLNVQFDLSKTLFIGTANTMATVPPALRDRMEVIEFPGYTLTEKLRIAQRYLLPRQVKENGLSEAQLKMREATLKHVIAWYTREAGVRELERRIGAICRAVAARVAAGRPVKKNIAVKDVARLLGPPTHEREVALRTAVPGVATGLAYTPYGGEIIFIEASAFPGKGRLMLTGHIGDVMRESAQAALSLIKSQSEKLGIDSASFATNDIHVHVPAGAVPKDGPSAGVAMVTALGSMMLNRSVRSEVAMTGEITLRGLVLPVGGIKEKILAARQAGIKTIILPDRNRRQLGEVPAEARKSLRFVFAKTIDDVLDAALVDGLKAPRRRRSNSPRGRKRQLSPRGPAG